jgi:hypothetical protein
MATTTLVLMTTPLSGRVEQSYQLTIMLVVIQSSIVLVRGREYRQRAVESD